MRSKSETFGIIRLLNGMAKANGGELSPEKVVDVARPANHPLHDFFTWDNSEAAHQYRLYQARTLIRVMVKTVRVDGANMPMRVFVSLTPDRAKTGGGYRTMVDVLSRKELRDQLLLDALTELETMRLKYAALKELVAVFREIRTAAKKVGL